MLRYRKLARIGASEGPKYGKNLAVTQRYPRSSDSTSSPILGRKEQMLSYSQDVESQHVLVRTIALFSESVLLFSFRCSSGVVLLSIQRSDAALWSSCPWLLFTEQRCNTIQLSLSVSIQCFTSTIFTYSSMLFRLISSFTTIASSLLDQYRYSGAEYV